MVLIDKLTLDIASIGYEGETNTVNNDDMDICLDDNNDIFTTEYGYYDDDSLLTMESVRPEPFTHRTIEL
jgi:hypothetical protein